MGVNDIVFFRVLSNGAPNKAGLKRVKELYKGRIRLSDIIISIDGDPVRNFDNLVKTLEQYNVGDQIKSGVRRYKKDLTLKITIQAVQ